MSAAVLRQTLAQVKARGGQFTADDGEILITIYSNDSEMALLQAASDLVERERVTRVEATPSGRTFTRVTSQSRHATSGGPSFYICFPHYCSCATFLETTVHSKSTMCKHMLAALLADATGKLKLEFIPDVQYANMLCPVSKE
ncbi:Aste57867_14597 [Aphanomyces stellatus]|uniref:Aste57867_14597 protein n=1 Tax=Aphanomyces stellatus TaxID=120398 RepID=A0A485L1E8_9STRA|nr:hypothetical protein As57867_014543 [Aphanomyces stellatus]VFT91416.1 Aste57867_14597 [Aphanomyces stellatus]